MSTITIPQKEYKRLKQYSDAYLKIAEEITKAERAYPYDYGYVESISRGAKKETWAEADSIDGALAKMKKK